MPFGRKKSPPKPAEAEPVAVESVPAAEVYEDDAQPPAPAYTTLESSPPEAEPEPASPARPAAVVTDGCDLLWKAVCNFGPKAQAAWPNIAHAVGKYLSGGWTWDEVEAKVRSELA